jgi:hypothetical protein
MRLVARKNKDDALYVKLYRASGEIPLIRA